MKKIPNAINTEIMIIRFLMDLLYVCKYITENQRNQDFLHHFDERQISFDESSFKCYEPLINSHEQIGVK